MVKKKKSHRYLILQIIDDKMIDVTLKGPRGNVAPVRSKFLRAHIWRFQRSCFENESLLCCFWLWMEQQYPSYISSLVGLPMFRALSVGSAMTPGSAIRCYMLPRKRRLSRSSKVSKVPSRLPVVKIWRKKPSRSISHILASETNYKPLNFLQLSFPNGY